MITHLVFWKLKDENKAENAQHIKESLEGLVGVVPELLEARVGLNYNGGEYDLALYSRFRSVEDLQAYDAHPAHQAVRAFVRQAVTARTAVDFEE